MTGRGITAKTFEHIKPPETTSILIHHILIIIFFQRCWQRYGDNKSCTNSNAKPSTLYISICTLLVKSYEFTVGFILMRSKNAWRHRACRVAISTFPSTTLSMMIFLVALVYCSASCAVSPGSCEESENRSAKAKIENRTSGLQEPKFCRKVSTSKTDSGWQSQRRIYVSNRPIITWGGSEFLMELFFVKLQEMTMHKLLGGIIPLVFFDGSILKTW